MYTIKVGDNKLLSIMFIGIDLFLFSLLTYISCYEYEYFSCCNDNVRYQIKILKKEGHQTEYYPLKRILSTNFWVHMSYDCSYGDKMLQYLKTEAEAQDIINDDIKQTVVTNKCIY